jgi:hypothetical protein
VSGQASVTVNVPATITENPQSQAVIAGVQVKFTVSASGSGELTYQWRFKGDPIQGATNPTFAIAIAQIGDAGAYDVVVGNASGWIASATAELKVIEPPLIARQPASLKVAAGTSGTVVSDVASLGVQEEVMLKIAGISRAADGTFDLLLSGPAGQEVTLQYSADLEKWASLSRIVMNNGQVLYKDIRTAVVKACYYRLAIGSTETIPLVFEAVGKSGPDRVYLKLSGPPEAICVIQMSGDLKTWSPVYTNSIGTGVLEWTHNGISENEVRFYRGVINKP